MFKRLSPVFIGLLIATLMLAACGGAGGSATTETGAVTETESTAPTAEAPPESESESTESEPVATGGAGYYDRALAGDYTGTNVKILGPFSDVDEQRFLTSIEAFEQASGIDIEYTADTQFDTSISIRVDGGDKPDIAFFPQPGLLARFVQEGHVIDVSTFLPEDYLKGQYNESWLDMARMEGPAGPMIAGIWSRINGKSLVWYPKDDFEAAGYEIPTTWDEMLALSDQIVADGDTPWCIGISSGGATGWPATDWVEDIMLRTVSLEDYDRWTSGELPFSSPEVRNAFEIMSNIFFNDEYVNGGRSGITTLEFGDAPLPMFEDPPRCWLHRQGNFITAFFPEGVQPNVDYGFFYLPPIDEASGKPFLVGGDIVAMMNDRDEVRAVMEFLTRGESLKGWVQSGGAISPHLDTDLSWYGNEIERGIAEVIRDATSFRYDGSDLMPGQVGAGSFWTGVTTYINGDQDLDTVLSEIDASWPR